MSQVTPGNYQRRIFNGSGLDTNARFVAVYLSRLAHTYADEDGWFQIPDREIAAALAIHRKTVANRVDALEQSGWLEVQQVVSGNRYQSTRYRLAVPAKAKAVQPKPKRNGQFTTDNQPSRGRSDGHLEPSSRGRSDGHLEPSSRGRSQRQELSLPATTKSLTSNVVVDAAPPSGGGDDDKGNPPFGALATAAANRLCGTTPEQRRRKRERERRRGRITNAAAAQRMESA